MAKEQFHESYHREAEPERHSSRQIGLVIGGFCMLLGLRSLLHGRVSAVFVAGAALVSLALLAPKLLEPLAVAWIWLGRTIGKVTTPIVLGILFYGVVTPTSWLVRLLGKDSLRLRKDTTSSTYWIERTPPGPAPRTMANQF